MDFTLDQWYADQQKYADMLDQEDEQKYGLGAERGPNQIYHPKTKEDYNNIPVGGIYVDPKDGQMYKKVAPEPKKEEADTSNLA